MKVLHLGVAVGGVEERQERQTRGPLGCNREVASFKRGKGQNFKKHLARRLNPPLLKTKELHTHIRVIFSEGEKSFKIHNTEKNITFIGGRTKLQLKGADRFLSFRLRTARNSHVGHIRTKLTQNPSVYNKLTRGTAFRLPGGHKNKKLIRQHNHQ